jgi:hypothetical protein
MKLNPTLYKVVENKLDQSNFTDPFQKIMQQQSSWISTNQKHGYVKDMVYRTDLDHPNSMHNKLTGQQESMQVNFPKTANQSQMGGDA